MFSSNNVPFTMNVAPVGAEGYGGGMWGDGGWLWIIVVLLLFTNGWGGYGGGMNGAGAIENYVLGSDFATIQRQLSDGFNGIDSKLDGQNNGICNLGYTQLQLNNQLATQLADCCCKTQSGIESIKTSDAMNTSAILGAIKDCCCESDKIAMQNRFEAAQYNCNTLQAIDKVGDRIIDYLCNEKTQTLRDENFALKLAASQSMQNNYLIDQLKPPMPVPAFSVPAPWGYGNNGCGCNYCGC